MSSSGQKNYSGLSIILMTAVVTILVKMVLTPEIANPYLSYFNLQIGKSTNLPTNPLFCPDPKVLNNYIPGSVENSSILLGQRSWVVASVLPVTSIPTDYHISQVSIMPSGNLICTYAWGDPFKREQNFNLIPPHRELYRPVGFHWWVDKVGYHSCQSANSEGCAFSLM